jgi:hypothetical protein
MVVASRGGRGLRADRRAAVASDAVIDETPLASLIDALGPASTFDAAAVPTRDGTRTTRSLFALVVGALLLEWASRRLRGVR